MRVRDFTADHLKRTTAEQWMQGSTVVNTIATGYNADGEVTSAGDSYSNYAFAYDGQGHLASVDNSGTPGVPDVVLSSQFDAQGDRTSLSATIAGAKDFLNSYSYDTLSRLTSIEQQGQTGGNAVNPKTVNFVLDGIGDITQIYRMDSVGMGPNPQSDPADTAIAYNSLGQLTGITPSHNGVNIDPLSWIFDTLDREATFTNSDGTATYGYNPDNELTSVSYTGATEPPNESYSFDPNGNRTNNGFQAGTNNQLTTDGTFDYQYDQEGNRTVRTRISPDYATDYKTTYDWDYRNRLTDVSFYDNNNVLTKHVHYTYDVFNNLLSQSVDSTGSGSYNQITYFVYDLSKPSGFPGQSLDPTAVDPAILEFVDSDGSGPEPASLAERLLVGPDLAGLMDQVYAQENVSTGAVTWLLADNLGSTRDAVDANGDVLGHYVYNSFGQLASVPTSVTQFLFTGRWFDADTGLQYNGNRWYDPAAGRWVSEDPADMIYDTNASRYVHNRPTLFVDPTGLADQDDGVRIQADAAPGMGGYFGSAAVTTQADTQPGRPGHLTPIKGGRPRVGYPFLNDRGHIVLIYPDGGHFVCGRNGVGAFYDPKGRPLGGTWRLLPDDNGDLRWVDIGPNPRNHRPRAKLRKHEGPAGGIEGDIEIGPFYGRGGIAPGGGQTRGGRPHSDPVEGGSGGGIIIGGGPSKGEVRRWDDNDRYGRLHGQDFYSDERLKCEANGGSSPDYVLPPQAPSPPPRTRTRAGQPPQGFQPE